ncbi:MAG: RNA-splicing ligase RtcB [Nitrososphaeria archaeon]|nr:RNA-splicing ligase RtcB [Nitrososphaeria archaeon]NIN53434.1 RNA-splicing ligase RtcB [Nitrososphaeria archaeon]NIQ33949.1 RNA-splicing ligase RtcB [Nitrososphaeria archaeon]
MNVPVKVYASKPLLNKMRSDRTLNQATNVSKLPNIYKHSIVLPDGHEGYGFPIGGVAAFDVEEGVVSPGGVGYDINCGVRLLRTDLKASDFKSKIKVIVNEFFSNVPSGLGSKGKLRFSVRELEGVLEEGAQWAIKRGYGWEEDFRRLEEEGKMKMADSQKVSNRAKARGSAQLGSLGSGNHFLEINVVDKIFDNEVAGVFGIREEGQVNVLIHTGSRGLGHQVCGDYLKVLSRYAYREGIRLPDRELAYAHMKSREAANYLAAMSSACNFAWANRQFITYWVRESMEKVFGSPAEDLGLHVVYDVAHNIAKLEEHQVNGSKKKVIVHRKGATRSFPPESPGIPQEYSQVGQPVFIPGTMGTSSWVMVGVETALDRSFGSSAHGAGRLLSRKRATRTYRGSEILSSLGKRGIVVKPASIKVMAEESPGSYKDVDEVADVSHSVGVARKVARLVPMAVVKG